MQKTWLNEGEIATLADKVADKIREAIFLKRFKEGEKLRQEELARLFGVSRMPIRDAFQKLENEGLIEIIPRRGAVVLPIRMSDIEEIYELRSVLECIAIEKSLGNLTKDDILELEQIAEKMEQINSRTTEGIEEFIDLNKQFHRKLRVGCHWRKLNLMIENLWSGIAPLTPKLLPENIERSNKEHRKILEYVKQKETEKLSKMLKTHILNTKESLVELLREQRQLS